MRLYRLFRPLRSASSSAVLLASICAVCVSGCAGRGGSVPYERADFGAPDADGRAVPASQQRIGPLDKLRISVFQVEALSGEFEVDGDGNVQFPLIGAVSAAGLTAAELAQQIGLRLNERYLRSPNVQVVVTEPSQQTITVDGAVRMPGALTVRGTTTIN